MEADYLPSKEEIETRIKQLIYLRDSGLSPKIIESVMHYNKPTFDEVVEELSSKAFDVAEANLFERIQK
jgi:hypothetical protein